MSVMRWDPWRNRFATWNGLPRLAAAREAVPVGPMDLALDMYETDDSVIVELSVPGVDPKDIQVRVLGNRLTIEGESKTEHKAEDQSYVLQERRYGRFYRAVTLPERVKAGEAQAEFEHGVLKLTVPKLPEAKPTTVQVKSK